MLKTALTIFIILLIATLIYLFVKPGAPSTTKQDQKKDDELSKLKSENQDLRNMIANLKATQYQYPVETVIPKNTPRLELIRSGNIK